MIRNTCGKFQSNTSSGYLENLENIHLHANLNIGYSKFKRGTHNSKFPSLNQFRVTFLTLPNRFNDKEHLWKVSIQYKQWLLRKLRKYPLARKP